MNFQRRHLNWLPNWQSKNKGGSKTLKGSQRMGCRRIFPKTSVILSLMPTYQIRPFTKVYQNFLVSAPSNTMSNNRSYIDTVSLLYALYLSFDHMLVSGRAGKPEMV